MSACHDVREVKSEAMAAQGGAHLPTQTLAVRAEGSPLGCLRRRQRRRTLLSALAFGVLRLTYVVENEMDVEILAL